MRNGIGSGNETRMQIALYVEIKLRLSLFSHVRSTQSGARYAESQTLQE